MKRHEEEGSLADWLRDQDGAEDPGPLPQDPGYGRPRNRLLTLAALPWALALALALLAITRATRPDVPPPEPGGPAPPAAIATPGPGAPPEPVGTAPPAPDALPPRPGAPPEPVGTAPPAPDALPPGPDATPPPTEPGGPAPPAPDAPPQGSDATPAPRAPVPHERSGEVGALLVRAALSEPGDDGTASRYVDEAVATQVETVGDAAVVTVLAVVLEGGERGWERASLARYGVAVRAGTAVAGPWPLPAPAPAPDPGAPVDDPALHESATAALTAAGYGDVTALHLTRDPALPGVLRAAFLATAPSAATPTDQTALLRDAPEPLLLGSGPNPNTPA